MLIQYNVKMKLSSSENGTADRRLGTADLQHRLKFNFSVIIYFLVGCLAATGGNLLKRKILCIMGRFFDKTFRDFPVGFIFSGK